MRNPLALGMVWSAAACSAAPAPSVPVSPAAPAEVAARPPAPPPDPCASPGHWETVAPLELRGRVDHTAVWTGNEMLMWGGTRGTSSPYQDGARYVAASDRWQPTSLRGAPQQRDDHAAVWTGREMIVWGGNSYDEYEGKLNDGGRYDPVTDTWRRLPDAGLTTRDDPRAVWTGDEMIVWGGRDQTKHVGDGAAYDPRGDRWRPLSGQLAPAPREDHIALWTGREMIVWGGWNGDDRRRNYALDAARFDPRTNTWRPMSTAGAPEPREDHVAIWTGREMIVWGGVRRDGKEGARRQLATGGAYDPATDTWRALSAEDAPSAREDGVVVWTGREMLVWGGQRDERPLADGARYLPDVDRWCALPTDGAPAARRDHAGVWTGDALVIWGGRDADGDFPATGAAYVTGEGDPVRTAAALTEARTRTAALAAPKPARRVRSDKRLAMPSDAPEPDEDAGD